MIKQFRALLEDGTERTIAQFIHFKSYLFKFIDINLKEHELKAIEAKNLNPNQDIEMRVFEKASDVLDLLVLGQYKTSRLFITDSLQEKFMKWLYNEFKTAKHFNIAFCNFLYPENKSTFNYYTLSIAFEQFRKNPSIEVLKNPLHVGDVSFSVEEFNNTLSQYPIEYQQAFKFVLAWVVSSLLKIYLRHRRFYFSPALNLIGPPGCGKSTLAQWLTCTMFGLPETNYTSVFNHGSLMKMLSIHNTTIPILLDDIRGVTTLSEEAIEIVKSAITNGYLEITRGRANGKTYKVTRYNNLLITSNEGFYIRDTAWAGRIIVYEFPSVDFVPHWKELHVIYDMLQPLGTYIIKKINSYSIKEVDAILQEVKKIQEKGSIRKTQQKQFIEFGARLLNKIGILNNIELDYSRVSYDYAIKPKDFILREIPRKLIQIFTQYRGVLPMDMSLTLSSLLSGEVLSNDLLAYLAQYGVYIGKDKKKGYCLRLSKDFFKHLDSCKMYTKLKQIADELGTLSRVQQILKTTTKTSTITAIDITPFVKDLIIVKDSQEQENPDMFFSTQKVSK